MDWEVDLGGGSERDHITNHLCKSKTNVSSGDRLDDRREEEE